MTLLLSSENSFAFEHYYDFNLGISTLIETTQSNVSGSAYASMQLVISAENNNFNFFAPVISTILLLSYLSSKMTFSLRIDLFTSDNGKALKCFFTTKIVHENFERKD